MLDRGPHFGEGHPQAPYFEEPKSASDSVTLKRIGLTERFLIVQLHRPLVKSFEKFFYNRLWASL